MFKSGKHIFKNVQLYYDFPDHRNPGVRNSRQPYMFLRLNDVSPPFQWSLRLNVSLGALNYNY